MMGCIVCGASPTVKSHIIPRALFHSMKRPGKTVIGSRTDGFGYRTLQSGFWDDTILCSAHESELGKVDDYGIRFCREFHDLLKRHAAEVTVPNPKPRLLVDFAKACVWRNAASRGKHHPERLLGPYGDRLMLSLFGGVAFDPLLLVSRHAYRARRSEPLNLGTLPYPYFEEGIRFWRFIVCGLIFDLKLDNRNGPPATQILGVNQAKEITLFEDFPQNALRTAGLGRSLAEMTLPPERPSGNLR